MKLNQSEIKSKFYEYTLLVKEKSLRETCADLLHFQDFWTHVASIKHHHSYEQGLIVHTLEVTHNALHIASVFPKGKINTDVLITAGLWHDLGKIWDYEKIKDLWMKADYHGNIHHISGSCAEFTASARKHNVPDKEVKAVQHAILSHHGCKEWNSVRTPDSIEAVILHQADMLSAKSPHHEECPT